ncbi:MAG: endolytic transglycosylase MltG [Leptospiraceae bacterium]|nr:endolytic transglycosylase MltG [Leptospiraceae bacterium]MCB1304267.1 endolytic transglycosylase MltG [Leptospiraceae bacterium]
MKKIDIRYWAGAAVFIGMGLFLYIQFLSPGRAAGDGSNKSIYDLKHGSGAYTVASDLEKKGLIRSADYFKLYMRLTGMQDELKAGSYELNDGMSTETIASVLTEGKVRMMQFTIPEGWHNRQIAELMVEKGFAKNAEEFLKLTHDPAILKKYNIPADSTEGYLFPETYTISYGYPLAKIHEAMLERFFDELSKAEPPENLSPKELHKRVILASIIEREAARKDELPEMSRVFLNRLDKGMRLESCATIQYLLPKPREKLYEKDLKIPSPYNTYEHGGLPPGPISNPGLPALKAAFHPTEGDFLFFVLKPDGSHYFSKTFQEHVKAKHKYLGS